MPTLQRSVRVGVIGYGLAGRVFHAPFVSAVPGLALRAIVARHGDEAARAWPEATILRSAEEAIASPEIDLVVVATPNETHFDLAQRALLAGKHVVVDKPFAASAAQAKELETLAGERSLVVAPFHNRRWDGDFLTVRRLLADGVLGRLVSFESHFDRFRPIPREHTWKEQGGDANGLLMDLGPHMVDQTLALFGPPASLVASVRRDRDETAIDDAFDLWLGYDRMQVWLRSTILAAEASPRFLLHGTRGSYRKFGLDPQEPALVAGASVPPIGDPRPWLPEDRSAWGELTVAADPAEPGQLERTRVETAAGDYRGFYANVRDAILDGATLAVTPEDARRTLRLLELARESSRERERLTVDLDG